MAIPINNGYFNSASEQIEPNNQETWADLSGITWADWGMWSRDPVSPHYYTSPGVISLSEPSYVNFTITGDCVGAKSFQIHASSSGLFTGEETTTVVGLGDTDIPVFYGQYFRVTLLAEFDQASLNVIRGISTTTSNKSFEITFRNLDSSSLSGTISARELVMPRTVSNIQRIHITPFAPDTYVLSGYVSSDYFLVGVPAYPGVISKQASGPKIAFVQYDGTYTDAIFDALLVCQPEQYINDLGDLDIR